MIATHQTAAVPHSRNCLDGLLPQVAQALEGLLRRSPYFELRSVSCECHEGVLTLQGRVPSYYLKQLAQSLLSEVPGVVQIDNRVEVVASTSFQNPVWRESDSCAFGEVRFR